jgi:hypothetical protein
MATKIINFEVKQILENMPVEQLVAFAKIRGDEKLWSAFSNFVKDQKQIKLDQIYLFRRPKNIDDTVKNAIDHEYYSGRISGNALLLQIIENAPSEIERRERRKK